MLFIGLCILAIFGLVSYLRSRDYDLRFRAGKEIAEHIDLAEIFETTYLGAFKFDETPPNEDLRKNVERDFDRGVESRLALHFAKTLPKWVLQGGAADIKKGQFSFGTSIGGHIRKQVYVFAEARRVELSGMLKTRAATGPDPDRRQRRRRR